MAKFFGAAGSYIARDTMILNMAAGHKQDYGTANTMRYIF
jgi:hypothetical protein